MSSSILLKINGSEGNIYDISIENDTVKCSCQAGRFEQLCKHILALYQSDYSDVAVDFDSKAVEITLEQTKAYSDVLDLMELIEQKNKLDNLIKGKKKSIQRKLYKS